MTVEIWKNGKCLAYLDLRKVTKEGFEILIDLINSGYILKKKEENENCSEHK
jgi:hypothetical protein